MTPNNPSLKTADEWRANWPTAELNPAQIVHVLRCDYIQQIMDEQFNAAIEAAADMAVKEQTGNPATLSHYLRCEEAILALKRPTKESK